MDPLTTPATGEPGDPPQVPGQASPGETSTGATTAPDTRPARMVELDVYRGVTILAVVLHHLTGLAIRHAAAGSLLGGGLMVLNRGTHFVVPAFLFLTALVLTRSALRRFHLGAYVRSRVQKVLVPYLFWTAAYVGFRVFTAQDPPAVLGDPDRWRVWLQYGKGYFHLYFLLIALQFSLILPLLLPLFRRRPRFRWVLVGAVALQLLVYLLNRSGVLHFRFPATMVLWYLPVLGLGMAFGSSDVPFGRFWHRWRLWIVAATLLTFAWYVPLSVALLQRVPVSSAAYSLANWSYTTAASLALLGLAQVLTRAPARLVRVLTSLGTVSLQVYLLHPAVLLFLERRGFPGDPARFVLVLAAYGAVALAVPLAVARLLAGTRVARWVFGR
ncbi:acetyltransferase, fucose-4-O-acetylase [Deinococcus aerius]|uniref:Acetyltransferase, fucose-4-O-acetylase n=3 Tax=Deinococcus TaxID=1298 RepID=A0A2I9D2V2_9DEIO|nr:MULTISPECIES: acyltransferase [Deinococcus]MBB5293670.1 peptidoglycan/LPS O-acetylase OafA/YrhL [Deinococcus metallilatus]GBF04450.1 acetyltransferase, fucose-4-O-acetylase [Deinococcus aerius]GMA17600.1 acyltransferase [Deinococcus metallilatus]